jgi:hypothetical protein
MFDWILSTLGEPFKSVRRTYQLSAGQNEFIAAVISRLQILRIWMPINIQAARMFRFRRCWSLERNDETE